MKHLILILCLGLASCAPRAVESPWSLSFDALPAAALGKTENRSFYAESLKRDWNYSVYFPAGYDTNRRYPVVYLIHGAYGKNSDWKRFGEAQIILDKAIAAKKIPPVIALMPDGQDAWYADIPGTNMRSAFEKDLFPYVETNFPVINKKEARAIGGFSMGGHGTLIFALGNPAYFASGFVLSPAITKEGKTPGKMLKELVEKDFTHVYGKPFNQSKWDEYSYHPAYKSYLAQENKVRFMVATGTDDDITPVEDAQDLIADFQKDGIEHKYIEMPTGSHSWGFWTLALAASLEYVGKTMPQPETVK